MIDDNDIHRLDEITEFFQLANGMEYEGGGKSRGEVRETGQVINPRLYAGVIKKLKS